MKQVDKYIKTAFRYTQGDVTEIEDCKLEMKNHLLESIYELKKLGLSDKEAFNIAIDRFGGMETMSFVARQLFHVQRIFAKRILLIAVVTAVLTCLLALMLWRMDTQQKNDNQLLAQSIYSTIIKQSISSDETKAAIQKQLEEQPYIVNAKIYPTIEQTSENGTTEILPINYEVPDYYYDSQKKAPDWRSVLHGYHFNDSSWLITFDVMRWFAFVPIILSFGYAIYATLFTVWATINVYHHQRLKIYWIVLFAITNIIGYSIYLLVDYIQVRKVLLYRSNPVL